MLAKIRCGYATFIRNWRVNLRVYNWSFFISSLGSGLLTVVVAYFFYHSLASEQVGGEFIIYTGTPQYMSYVIIGASVLTFSISIMLGVSRSMITERREGTLESLLIAPAKRLEYFVGVAAQCAVTSFAEMLIMLLVSWPLGLDLSHINGETLALALPILTIGLLGMAIVLGSLMLSTGDTYISQNTLFAAMTLICGFVFPFNYLPLPLQWLSSVLPVTGGLSLIRAALLTGTPPVTVFGEIIIYTVLGLVYVVVGLVLMRRAEQRALEGV